MPQLPRNLLLGGAHGVRIPALADLRHNDRDTFALATMQRREFCSAE